MAYDDLRRVEDQGQQYSPTSSNPSLPEADAVGAFSRSDSRRDGAFPRSRRHPRQERNPGTDVTATATTHRRHPPTESSSPSTLALLEEGGEGGEGPMSHNYRDRDDYPHRPLIDLIPDHNDYDLDVSDEEDGFYARDDDDDYLLHPKWRAMINQTTNRIPRRIQRYFVIYLAFAFAFLVYWKVSLGAQYKVYRQDLKDMDDTPQHRYGLNVKPEFKGMVQVKNLEEKYLPKGEGRLVVVGDVHGCREELEHLLKKVEFDKAKDHLILTGDIIAKGPDSPGVVSLAEKFHASCVRGNHEDKVLLLLAEMSSNIEATLPGPNEPENRTSDTLEEESFSHGDYKTRKLAKSFSHKQVSYLKECPVILRVGDIGEMGEVVVVHAGLVPDIPLEQQDPFQVMNMRTIDLKTRLPSENRDGTPWEKFWNHYQKKKPAHERVTVIYGHDKKRGKNIQKYSFGLDSGCVSGGQLTAVVIDASGKHHFEHVKCKGYVD